ncbi:MAG: ABC transporter ATP-binding protein [Treponema sp.]|nr:ABC transporter ATP-binding protein [Treponema sp.]
MTTDSNDKDLIVRIEGLEKTYKSSGESLTILKNLDMKVSRGSKCVIVGKSGSGKSTLLNIIGGLDTASSGRVEIDGEVISSLREEELTDYRQKFLGLIFQFHYLLKDFTALENVFLPSYMAGVSKKEAMEKARSLLNDVGLSDRTDHLPSALSGGERQRVAVARSLINDPELILADEPTGNLDPANAAVIGDLLFSMADKYKKTLILVTHDMNLAAKGDLRLFLKNGALTEDGEL